jgi:hypothetical protein
MGWDRPLLKTISELGAKVMENNLGTWSQSDGKQFQNLVLK